METPTTRTGEAGGGDMGDHAGNIVVLGTPDTAAAFGLPMAAGVVGHHIQMGAEQQFGQGTDVRMVETGGEAVGHDDDGISTRRGDSSDRPGAGPRLRSAGSSRSGDRPPGFFRLPPLRERNPESLLGMEQADGVQGTPTAEAVMSAVRRPARCRWRPMFASGGADGGSPDRTRVGTCQADAAEDDEPVEVPESRGW